MPERSRDSTGGLDVVFPLLHGPYGEDGTLQGLLELAGLPYVGSGVFASAAAMDKQQMKLVLRGHGLPVGPYEVVTPREWEQDPRAVVLRLKETLALPVFVKPARGGSSIGISKVTDAVRPRRGDRAGPTLRSQGRRRGDAAGARDRVRRARGPRRSRGQPARPRSTSTATTRSTTSRRSTSTTGTSFDIPARLTADETAAVQALACAGVRGPGLRGTGQGRLLPHPDGLVVNEVNTMPGFTPASMFPRMWAASGVDYPALVDRLLTSALTRRRGLR